MCCFTRITLLFAVIEHLNNHGGHRGSLIALLLRVVCTVLSEGLKNHPPIQDRDCSSSHKSHTSEWPITWKRCLHMLVHSIMTLMFRFANVWSKKICGCTPIEITCINSRTEKYHVLEKLTNGNKNDW